MFSNIEYLKNKYKNKKIGFTCSCFDLLHSGHCIMLKDAKEQCDILIVGLQTDPTIDRPEKNKPIQTLQEREIQIKSCRYVDYYFIYDTEQNLYQSILYLLPNIRFLGDDYKGKKFTGDDLPVQVFYHPRSNHNYSTTKLRQLIYKKELEKKCKLNI